MKKNDIIEIHMYATEASHVGQIFIYGDPVKNISLQKTMTSKDELRSWCIGAEQAFCLCKQQVEIIDSLDKLEQH